MKSFSELITNRHSTRKFSDEELSQEEVVSLLKAALMSPSSKNSRGWHFIIVDDKDKIAQLSTCKEHGAAFLKNAPLAIVVTADPMVSTAWVEDTSIAALMLQLQAEDMGLGSCWVQIRERFDAAGNSAEQNVRDILELPLQLQVLAVIAVGKKVQTAKPIDEDKLLWENVHINGYGGK